MSYDNNPYYSPEKFGLTLVGSVDLTEPCYSFDMFVVWRDAAGTFYWGKDSGCSCPSPFEDIEGLDDLSKGNVHQAIQALQESHKDSSGEDEAVDLIERLLKEN